MSISIVQSDCLDFLRSQPEGSIDLVFGSPPYEEARLYLEGGQNLGISRKTDAWVAWMVEVYRAAQTACKGLVAFVVAGQTRNYRWSAGPALLMAELHRAGMNLRNPPLYYRIGIPGSGGPDWWRSDYEWVICTSRPGRLPWSDNTATGAPPKYQLGGEMCYRLQNGERRHKTKGTSGYRNGDTITHPPKSLDRKVTEIANPGNVVEGSDFLKCVVGGGKLGEGSVFAHDNEAPFPEELVAPFIVSFCPPGGIVCDPFSGSGTAAAVCKRHGRNFTGCDLRQSQVELGLKRVANETPMMFT